MIKKVKVRIRSKRGKEVVKRILQENINIYDITPVENDIDIILDLEDYERLKKKKIFYQSHIIKYYGLERVKEYTKKYKVLGLSIILGILLNIFLSFLILKVEIKTPNPNHKKTIKKELESLGIKPLSFQKSKKDILKIKEDLLKQDSHIEWLEIERIGTKYIITVEEKKRVTEETCPNRNIIAKKKAVITKIESSQGEILKKKNDYVEKGEVIISGAIHNKEEMVSKKCAEGKVYGETWYKVTVEIPKVKETRKKLNKFKWKLKIGNKDETSWIVQKEYTILKSNLYSFSIKLLHLQKIRIKKEQYSIKNIEKTAFLEAEKQLKNHLKVKPTIIQKKVLKKSLKNSKIIVDVFFAIEEDITSYGPILEEVKEE